MLLLYPQKLLLTVTTLWHLHSIMLLLYLPDAVGTLVYCYLFTFHYASTLSMLSATKPADLYNLHSIMLLLYPGGFGSLLHPSPFTFHYASTLSAAGQTAFNALIKFTFHYASTLSCKRGYSRL